MSSEASAVAAATTSAVAAPAKKAPAEWLRGVVGKSVAVRLSSGTVYKGVLVTLDGFMNIAMEQAEEYVDGQLRQKYGDCFIRGNNVVYISTQRRKA